MASNRLISQNLTCHCAVHLAELSWSMKRQSTSEVTQLTYHQSCGTLSAFFEETKMSMIVNCMTTALFFAPVLKYLFESRLVIKSGSFWQCSVFNFGPHFTCHYLLGGIALMRFATERVTLLLKVYLFTFIIRIYYIFVNNPFRRCFYIKIWLI